MKLKKPHSLKVLGQRSVAAVDPTNRAALLDALGVSAATVAVIGDAPGSVMQVFPVCGLGIMPSAGGCVSVTKLDATGGQPVSQACQTKIASFHNQQELAS